MFLEKTDGELRLLANRLFNLVEELLVSRQSHRLAPADGTP